MRGLSQHLPMRLRDTEAKQPLSSIPCPTSRVAPKKTPFAALIMAANLNPERRSVRYIIPAATSKFVPHEDVVPNADPAQQIHD